MEENNKLKLKATISAFVSERDEAHAAILDILDNPNELNPVDSLIIHFRKLSLAKSSIETVQMFYANNENLNIVKELQKNTETDDNTT